jgi:hypothetical protein
MMKSVTAVENRKERCRRLSLRLFTWALGVVLLSPLLQGCGHPGETWAEIDRRHERMLRLNSQMMMADIDHALLLDQPSMLTPFELP